MGLRELVVDANPFYNAGMKIDLPADQQKWLESEVAAGRFSSVEEAIAVAVSDLRTVGSDDLSWMKPYVEAARREAEAGNTISGEDFIAELDQIVASLPSR
jgi:Arc/MetJ-type ribon-helix-helix transcriptional regulator